MSDRGDRIPDPVRGPFPTWLLGLLALLGLALAGTSDGLVTAVGILLYSLSGLILGLLTPASRRGGVVRLAGVGMVLQALVRAGSEWATGGVAGLSLGSILPPSAVSLCAFLAAVVLGAWLHGIWLRGDEPDRLAERETAWRAHRPARSR